MTALRCFVLLVAMLPVVDATAQETTKPEDKELAILAQKIEAFFDNLRRDNVTTADALGDLLADGPLAQSDQRKALVEKVDALDDRFGKFIEAERIAATRVGKDLVVLRYLHKAERFPIVWNVTFYRDFKRPETTDGPGNWIVVALRFDTRLDRLVP